MTPTLLLSRTLDPADYSHMEPELAEVARHEVPAVYPHGRWGHTLALHAIARWRASGATLRSPLYDLSGTGDAFAALLQASTGRRAIACDPWTDAPVAGTPLADVILALGILDRIPDVETFLYHLTCLLAPGGLLILTMAFWDRCGPDRAVGHEARTRIFCPKTYAGLRQLTALLHLTTFGGVDPTWHGAFVHDHSIASLVLEKRR